MPPSYFPDSRADLSCRPQKQCQDFRITGSPKSQGHRSPTPVSHAVQEVQGHLWGAFPSCHAAGWGLPAFACPTGPTLRIDKGGTVYLAAGHCQALYVLRLV